MRRLKKQYKNELIEYVDKTYNLRISKRSDLYVYFFFKGLELLNSHGNLVFITSNSWLDVKFGRYLQEFLCKHAPIKNIFNNSAQRSFEEADINTVISVIGAVNGKKMENKNWRNDTSRWPHLLHEAQFINFKKPYYEVINPKSLHTLEADSDWDKKIRFDRTKFKVFHTNDFRRVVIKQGKLLEDGWSYPEGYSGESFKKGEYKGNKCGGKFIRAPDIYWTIMEKGEETLVEVGEIASVEGYIHGNNVGEGYPKVPFLESIEEAQGILLDEGSKGVKSFGVKDKGNSRTLADLLFPRMIGKRFFVAVNVAEVYGQKFYKIICNTEQDKYSIGAFLNSSIEFLQNEIMLNAAWGMGALSANSSDVRRLHVIPNLEIAKNQVKKLFDRPVKDIFTELGFHKQLPIREQTPDPLPDRKELDDIIFDALGLSKQERKEVYWAIAELVKSRLEKAQSV
ncbi:MAG: Eco57I restriction-modification methylase domain-containing protein [Thermoproteota archaeon]